MTQDTETTTTGSSTQQARLFTLLSPLIEPMGYELVYVELHTHRQKTLRLFIDRLDPSAGGAIGIEDCVKVSRALEEPLDQLSEVEGLFKGAYELEVSSPGVERPLRTARDFSRFAGKKVRIHTFRPLNEQELSNTEHLRKNPKQKNFLGLLKGLSSGDRVELALVQENGKGAGKPRKKGQPESATNSVEVEVVTIPLPLISKANLEPTFEFDHEEQEHA